MPAQLVRETFPKLHDGLLNLVTSHKKVKDEPLHLALAYADEAHAGELLLLEVIGSFGGELADPDRRLLEVAYPGAQVFPLLSDRRDLRLVLTSPSELRTALREEWENASAIRAAIRAGSYEVLAADSVGSELMAEISRATAA